MPSALLVDSVRIEVPVEIVSAWLDDAKVEVTDRSTSLTVTISCSVTVSFPSVTLTSSV